MAGFGSRHVEAEARRVVEQLGGRWAEAGGLCRCPAHADRTPSLSVRPGRTRLLLHCFAGCSASDVLRALEAQRVLGPAAPNPDPPPVAANPASFKGSALRLWAEARQMEGTFAEAYLAERGLRGSSPALRFHPRTPHGRFPSTRFRPAMIAAVCDADGLVAVHRTFLDDADGPRKCALGRLGEGAVRLAEPADTVGLAEGIETALAATALSGIPCWATLGTERFGKVSLPTGTRRLVLFLDRDCGGLRAEALARARFGAVANIEARYPPHPANDWNDLLLALTS